MCEKIRIENTGAWANIYTPYNKEFIREVKKIGGAKWNGKARCWSIPAYSVDKCREILLDVYGYDDSPVETTTVRVRILEDMTEIKDSVKIFGKTVARAYGRDSGSKVGEDVVLVSGKIDSGGSIENWVSVIEKGSIVELHNVPVPAIKPSDKYEIIKEDNKGELLKERDRLVARIAEIDMILKGESA